jgi:hypothetical protein
MSSVVKVRSCFWTTPKPDPKDVIVAVRQAILKDDSGDFTGVDIIHFVGFGKQPDEAQQHTGASVSESQDEVWEGS